MKDNNFGKTIDDYQRKNLSTAQHCSRKQKQMANSPSSRSSGSTPRYQVVEVNGWYLVQHWQGEGFGIDVLSKEDYRKYLAGKALFREQEEHLRSI